MTETNIICIINFKYVLKILIRGKTITFQMTLIPIYASILVQNIIEIK